MGENFLAPVENRSKAGRLIELFVLCFFAVMCLTIVYQGLTTMFIGWTRPLYEIMIRFVIVVILGCCLIAWIKLSPALVLCSIMLLSLGIRLFLVLGIPTEPAGDFLIMYKAALSAAAGDFSWVNQGVLEDYFFNWRYQIPFVLYEAAILRLFHSILALKLFNVLFMVGTNYVLYRIARLYLSEKAALCVALIYAVFPDTVLFSTILTNQIIALFFLLLGVLLLLRAGRWWVFALAGLSLAVSDLMRPEAVTVLTACLCCGALRCIQRPNLTTLRQVALSLAPVLACYWLVKSLTEGVLIWTNIAPYGIQNRIPEWKFIVGLGNFEGYGTYSEEHIDVLNLDSAERQAVMAELIRDLFRRPKTEILDFFVGKLRFFSTYPQSIEWILGDMDRDFLELEPPLTYAHMLRWDGSGMTVLLYLLALPAPVLMWKDGKRRGGQWLFFVAVVCVIICVFLLIEIQARYRFFAIPFWLLTGGVTLERLTQCKISLRRPPGK